MVKRSLTTGEKGRGGVREAGALRCEPIQGRYGGVNAPPTEFGLLAERVQPAGRSSALGILRQRLPASSHPGRTNRSRLQDRLSQAEGLPIFAPKPSTHNHGAMPTLQS